MYELNGREVTLEFLQGKAQEYNMDFDSYLEIMKTKGLVEKTTDVAEPGAAVASETLAPASGVLQLVDTSLESQPKITGLAEVEPIKPGEPGYVDKSSLKEKAIIGAYAFSEALGGISDYANAISTNVEVFAREAFGDELTGAEKKAIQLRNKMMSPSSTFDEISASLAKHIDRSNGSIIEDLADGNIKSAADKTVDGAIESIPSLVAARLGPWGMAALGLSVAGNKFEEELFNDTENKNTGLMLLNASGGGAIEAGFEIFTRGLLKKAGLINDQFGLKQAKEFLTEGVLSFAKKLGGGAVVEGFSEAATELVSEYWDAISPGMEGDAKEVTEGLKALAKGDLDNKLVQRLGDAFVVGSAVGAGISTAGGINKLNPIAKEKAYNSLMSGSDQSALVNIANEASKLEKASENATEETKPLIEEKMTSLVSQANRIKGNNKLMIDNMSKEQLDTYVGIIDTQAKLRRQYLKSDTENKKLIDEKFKNLDKEAEDIRTKAEKTVLENYTGNVEAYAKDIGASFERFADVESFQKRYEELSGKKDNVKNVDGAFVGGVMLMNDVAAGRKGGAVSVAEHEFLHNIIGSTFDKLTTKEKINLNKSFFKVLNKDQQAAVKNRLKESYNISGEGIFETEEMFTAFTDAISKNEISFNESLFDKIQNVTEEIFRVFGKRSEFENGRQVYNFLKDYSKTIKKGKRSKRVTEFAKQDEVTVEGPTFTKKSMTAAEIDQVSDRVTEIGLTYNFKGGKALWDKAGADQAINEMKREGTIDNLIASKYKVKNVPKGFVSDVFNKLIPDIRLFDPEVNDDFGGYLGPRINFRAGDVYKKVYEKKEEEKAGINIGERTQEGEVKIQVAAETDVALKRFEEEDVSITAQIRAEKAEADPEAAEKQSKFRRALGFETGGDIYNKVLDAASKSIRLAYRKTQDIKNTSERAIAIREAIRKEYFTKGLTSDLFKPIKDFLGAKPYIKNLKEHREAIVNAISTADFVQMERKVADNERIFTVFDRKLTSKKDVQDAVNRDLLPLDALNKIDKGQAVNLYRKRMPTEAEFIGFADHPAVNPITGARSGLKGTRKDGFAKAISNTLILDATMEVRQSEEVVDALDNDISDLIELSAAIGREVDVKFSKSTAVVDINNAINSNTNLAVYSQIRFSKSHREAYEARLAKRRNDLDEDQIKKAVNSIFKFVDGENIPNNKKSKYEKLAMHYMANGFLILPEDGYKVIEADRIATIKKIDPFSYKNPNELIERFVGEVKGARTNPDTVEEFTNKKTLSNGVTVYDVADSKEGQIAVRKVIDTHFGKKANPWCLAARQGEYLYTEEAFNEAEKDSIVKAEEAKGHIVSVHEFSDEGVDGYEIIVKAKPDLNDMLKESFANWKNYNKEGNGYKIAFKNGKLLCFRDGNRKQWWDRNDKPSDKIHFIVKEKKGDVESTYSVIPEEGTKTLTRRIKGKMPTAEVFTLSEDVYFRRKFNTTFVNGLITKQKAEIVYKDLKLSTGIYIDAPDGAPDIQVNKITKDIETIDDRILTKEIEGKVVLASGQYKVYEDVDKVKIVHVTDVGTGETKSITVNGIPHQANVKFGRSSAKTAFDNKVKIQEPKDIIKEGGLSTLNADIPEHAQAIYEDSTRKDEVIDSVYKAVADVKKALQELRYKIIPKRADRLEQYGIDVWTESTSESDLIKVAVKERAEGIVPDVLLEIAEQPIGLETKADSFRTPARTIREENGELAISKRSKQTSYLGKDENGENTINYIDILIDQIKPKVKSENEFINKIIGRKWKGSDDRMTEKEFNKYKASKKRAPIVGKTTSVTDFAAFDYIQMTGNKPIPSVYITIGSIGTMTMGNFNPFRLKVPAFEGRPMELVIRERWKKTEKGYTRTFVVEGQMRTNEKSNGKNVFKKSPISFFIKEDVNNVVQSFQKEAYKDVKFKTDKDTGQISSFTDRVMFSKSLSPEFNKMLQRTKGVGVEKTFSRVAAQKRGKNVGKFRFFVPPSADDFAGLLRYFVGKGKQGDKDLEFFNEALIKPFARADEGMKKMRQRITDDYKTLRKTFPDVTKKLGNMIDDTGFTFDNAIRVYLWDMAGFEIPGLSKEDIKLLTNRVKTDQDLKNYANVVANIANQPEGYLEPGQQWEVESVASDLQNVVNKVGRKKFLGEWIENKNEIFSEENLNKIEATYGSNFREALENILWRMENGTNRAAGMGRIEGAWNNWINGSVGAIMFFNARSAVLQTLSTVNFINFEDNNIFAAAKAFANQKQYWKDFSFLFNSSFLKQRRAGLQTNINEAELASAVAGATNKAKAAIRYILKIGFTPTQVADSFAIASGGATYYRNRIKKYVKEGMDQKAAEKQAMLDFQEIAEETQQSARPDRISQQQASSLGRIILAFANTPMQYNRLIKKAAGDLVNKRGDWRSNVSRIIYYGALQNIIFSSLQSAIFALAFDDEEPEKDEIDQKTQRIINGTMDTLLRGSGIAGAVVATIKNSILEFIEQKEKKGRADYGYVLVEALNVSPPIGSKARRIYVGALKSYEYNADVIPEMGKFDLENPIYNIVGNITSATLNLPLDRVFRKIDNMKEVFNQDNQTWQRIALALGWDQWSLGIDPYKDVKEAEKKLREEKSKNKKKKSSLKGLKGLK